MGGMKLTGTEERAKGDKNNAAAYERP